MAMTNDPANSTKRFTSKGVLLLTIVTLKMIMYLTEFACGSDLFHYSVPWSFSLTPWERFQHVTFSCSHLEVDLRNFNGKFLLLE